MKEEYPDNYTPTTLRRKPTPKMKREIKYGVGIEHKPHELDMTDGPFPTLIEALEIVPESKLSKIIRFNENGTDDIIYSWNIDHWEREK
jgi:hypothetical protein